MKTATLYNATELAKKLIPSIRPMEFDDFDVDAVSEAFDNLSTRIDVIDINVVMREVKEMNMSLTSKARILRGLQAKQNASFQCKWVLPAYKRRQRGYCIVKNANYE